MTGRVEGSGAGRQFALRVLAAIADPQLEASLIPVLATSGRLHLDTCASARELLERLRGRVGGWGVVLTHGDLPHLQAGALGELVRRGLPLVILVRDPAAERWSELSAVILPHEATPPEVEAGLMAALAGDWRAVSIRETDDAEPSAPAALAATWATTPVDRIAATTATGAPAERDNAQVPWVATVYAVASGAGAPGRTTVALALATALGAVAPTLLIDADLAGPSVAAHLDADPSRNLYMLAGAAPRAAGEWEKALAAELQPLGAEAPRALVLCGVPRVGRGGQVTPQFLGRALDVLGRRFRHIILDVGADLTGGDGAAALHRAAVTLADHALLVGSSEIPGLRRQLDAFAYLLEELRVERHRIALVVNQHDRLTDHPQAAIERAFDRPLAALIPADHRAMKRALAAQHSVVLERRSKAATALLALAARAHGADLAPAPAPARARQARRWSVWPGMRRPARHVGGD